MWKPFCSSGFILKNKELINQYLLQKSRYMAAQSDINDQ